MLIKEALESATQALANSSDSPRLDAELLLAHCLNKNRSFLFAWPDTALTTSQQTAFSELTEKRIDAWPVAYLTGYQEFWSLNFTVNPDVLIPRADTETLVEAALETLQGIEEPLILDLGTGSGAIAIALASERPDASITASDRSGDALKVAELNKQRHDAKNLSLRQSNWFERIDATGFNLIVSNPPYIADNDAHLRGDIRHEPLQALASGKDGLSDINIIVCEAIDYLKPGGWLLLEHGHDQATDVRARLEEVDYQQVAHRKDLSGINRITMGQRPNSSTCPG